MSIFKWFKKKKQKENVYTKLGRLGISPAYMLMYQESIKKMKEFQKPS